MPEIIQQAFASYFLPFFLLCLLSFLPSPSRTFSSFLPSLHNVSLPFHQVPPGELTVLIPLHRVFSFFLVHYKYISQGSKNDIRTLFSGRNSVPFGEFRSNVCIV